LVPVSAADEIADLTVRVAIWNWALRESIFYVATHPCAETRPGDRFVNYSSISAKALTQ
jgi:hypothetical protein